MNGSRAATLTLAWRLASFNTKGFPIIPTAILVTVALVAIFADAQPCVRGEPCPTFGPASAVDYVLEVPAGSAKTWGLEKGAPITLKR